MDVFVSIGRNVKGEPMDDSRWNTFKAVTDISIATYGDIVNRGKGSGKYQNVIEESASWVLVIGEEELPSLKATLARLAERFNQEAIALLAGTSVFVGPKFSKDHSEAIHGH